VPFGQLRPFPAWGPFLMGGKEGPSEVQRSHGWGAATRGDYTEGRHATYLGFAEKNSPPNAVEAARARGAGCSRPGSFGGFDGGADVL